ncbi:MAG: hypothetical protein MI974_19785 [Chitinophagales bacterium]|nr:hypothetical protein [Chitinophagales bacterium]
MSSKLFEALMVLDEEQLPELEVFFNRLNNGLLESDRAIGTKLLQALKEGKNEETCWDYALNEKQKNNKKRIASRLFKVVENYLSSTLIPKDEVLHNLLLAKFYMNKGLVKHANHALKMAESKNNENRNLYFNHYLYKFKIEEIKASFKKHNRKQFLPLKPLFEAIKNYYELEDIRLSCERIQRSNTFRLYEEETLKKMIKDIRKKIEFSNTNEAKMYKYLINISTDFTDIPSYNKLRNIFNDNSLKLSPIETEDVISLLSNFCIRQANRGSISHATDFISYMEKLEQLGGLLTSSYYPLPIFKSMVSFGIISGQYDWTMQFINEKSTLLEESNKLSRKAFQQFHKGYTLLYMGQPSECFNLMIEFKNSKMYKEDVFYKIATDKTILKAYYHNNQERLIEATIATLEKYIRRNKKISLTHKKTQLKFVSEFKKLKKGKTLCFQDISALDKIWFQKITAL